MTHWSDAGAPARLSDGDPSEATVMALQQLAPSVIAEAESRHAAAMAALSRPWWHALRDAQRSATPVDDLFKPAWT